ncbi:MAG: cytochrome C oxidase subunit IV family protein, partial [Planctomycetia bacterium]
MAHSDADPHDGHPTVGHVLPLSTLFGVAGALMVLTGLTVALNELKFGEYDIVVAMFIATVKAILVGLYFMHLRYDKPLNAFFFCGSLVFVFIFLAACLLDTQQSRPTVAARDTV